MKKFILIGVVAFVAVFSAACGSKSDGGTVVDKTASLRAECASRADSFDARASILSSSVDSIDVTDSAEVRSFLRQARSFLADGRSIVSDCSSLLTSSKEAELTSLLDEFEASINQLDAIYS